MPTFLDRHDDVALTPEELAQLHVQDLEVQARHGVSYLSYWFDPEAQRAFCFVDAPDQAAAEAVHREAHGAMASRIIPVESQALEEFLGAPPQHPPGEAYVCSAFRAVLFTDLVDSTSWTQRLGDVAAMALVREHDAVVRSALTAHDGSEVKHTGDGIMASFLSAAQAVRTAVAIQRGITERNERAAHPLELRIGVSAGEPVEEGDDLFGAVVHLAARACATATPGSVLVSTAVRELCLGKGLTFQARGPFDLKGFDEPIALYEAWHD